MRIFIERFLLTILASLAVLFAVTNPMGFSVDARIIGVIIIVILAGIAAYFSGRVQRKPIVAIPAAPAPLAVRTKVKETEKEERIFVGESITPEYLLGFFQQHTAAQATNATKDYIGKWMKVAGPVGDVLSSTESFAQVTFARQQPSSREWFDYITVYMYFRGPWRDRAIILKKGDNITVIGQIREIASLDLHLDNCEFDDNRPKG